MQRFSSILVPSMMFVLFGMPLVRGEEPNELRGKTRKTYAIVLHGGAGESAKNWSDQRRSAMIQSLGRELKIGRDILARGGTSLDAVEQVLKGLEDDPLFNAGRGAVLNQNEEHELDASIMDGRTRACGAVASVRTVKHPITLARLVMTKTRHVLLSGDGADRFAVAMGVERVDPSYFTTDEARNKLERARQKDKESHRTSNPKQASPSDMGTVGCVALDNHGNLAAGTSTGGLTNKMPGRVGDSPIIGAGTFADNATCAVSCTGVGEDFIRHAVAFDISARMLYQGQSVAVAVPSVIFHDQHPVRGGVIAVSRDGQIAIEFNTSGMNRAAADSRGRFEVALGPKK